MNGRKGACLTGTHQTTPTSLRTRRVGNDATCRKNQRKNARRREAGLPPWFRANQYTGKNPRKREGDGSVIKFVIPKFRDDDERGPGMGGHFGHFHFDKGGPGGGGGFGLAA